MDRVWRQTRRVRAQSSVLGIVLILGLTLTVTSGIVVLGSAVLEDSQRESQVDQAEQALTQFDSRAAQVALGESSSQTVRVGGTKGDYRVRPDAGHVTIKHLNYTGSENETIHEGSLGALVFSQGDTEIAYQGGGVWRRDDGGATMVSPPEFHYRRATLTFPIVRVVGDGAASGGVTARAERTSQPRDIYPNASASYDTTSDNYLNPVENGTMLVTVESNYCRGWQQYFETRTAGNVTECQDGEVSAEIVSIGTQGEFDITNNRELNVRGVEDLRKLRLEFRDSNEQKSDFNNFEWSMAAENGDQQLEFYIDNDGGGLKCDGSSDPQNVTVEVYYSDNGGTDYSTWVNNDSRDDFQIVCEDGHEVLRVDLLSDASMDYQKSDHYSSGGGQSIPVFADDAESFNSTVPINGDDPEDIGNVTEHYMSEMGDMDFFIEEQNSAGIGDDSNGLIKYDGSGRVITFLHITENEIEIDLR
jgi:hypothetical protein